MSDDPISTSSAPTGTSASRATPTPLSTDAQQLVGLVRQAGQDWLLNVWPDLPTAADRISIQLRAAFDAYRQRYASSNAPGRFDMDVLIDHAKANPERLQALFQALGEAPSADELVMAWRIIEGDAIQQVDLHYESEAAFQLRVTLESTLTGEQQTFTSTNIESAALIRHWGIMHLGDQPLFSGFDPLPTA